MSILDDALLSLPVNLDLFKVSIKINPLKLLEDHCVDRLVKVLLIEQDNRISDQKTKFDVLETILYGVKYSTFMKKKIRHRLQRQTVWFDDYVSKDWEPIKDQALSQATVELFGACWKTTTGFTQYLIESMKSSSLTVELCKIETIRAYAATQFQSIIRGFLSRKKWKILRKMNKELKNNELRNWAIQIIQRYSRGYIARKTVIRSLRIRKGLTKEVLRITERFLQKGDMWGFLKEINGEISRVNQEMFEMNDRETTWASYFVKNIITARQSEFNQAWETFPKGISQQLQTLQMNDTSTQLESTHASRNRGPVPSTDLIGSLVTDDITTSHGMKHVSTATVSTSQPRFNESTSSFHPMNADSSVHLASTINQSTLSAKQSLVQSLASTAPLTQQPHSLPGPLIRKALANTIQSEVQKELDALIKGGLRSRRLIQDMKTAYGRTSPKPIRNTTKQKKKSNQSNSLKPQNGLKLSPLDIMKEIRKKKKGVSLDGQIIELSGKIEANQSDWMSSASSQSSLNPKSLGKGDGEKTILQPGHSLLIDIPLGINDSIEKLLYASALRCYVPEFFRGVNHSVPADDNLSTSSFDTYSSSKSPQRNGYPAHEISDTAYQMYLDLPLGLAKMRYELECQKWSQGTINKLKIKGLQYLKDVQPLSKFIMYMKGVESPLPLMNKSIELYQELVKLGNIPSGGPLSNTGEWMMSTKKMNNSRDSQRSHQFEGDAIRQSEDPKRIPDTTTNGATLPMMKKDGEDDRIGEHRLGGPVDDRMVKGEVDVEVPSKLLLNMAEEDGPWCSLQASVEELFLQAAYMIVPHDESSVRSNASMEMNDEPSMAGRLVGDEVSKMSNNSFKHHAKYVLGLPSEEAQREAIKERFRVALIMVTPFCIYLKGQNVFKVVDLLGFKDWKTMNIPSPLFTQLEVLLTVIVGKAVQGKILPTIRNHRSDVDNIFMVPMIYDPKFQRSPFDPYGKPPQLQRKPLAMKPLNNVKGSGEPRSVSVIDEMHRNHNELKSEVQLEDDMERPKTIWSTWQERSVSSSVINQTTSSSIHSKSAIWRFDASMIEEDESYDITIDGGGHSPKVMEQQKTTKSSDIDINKNYNKFFKKLQRYNQKQLTSFNKHDTNNFHVDPFNHTFQTENIHREVFAHSYTCSYPHCGQVFSRAYTYKVHLKTHEWYGQYHEFKRQPQIGLDPTKDEIQVINKKLYDERTSLHVFVNHEISALHN